MKKILIALMAGIMAFSCCSCANHSSETSAHTDAQTFADTPLDLLEKIWDSYSEDEKFPAAGGDFSEENMSMDGPGKYDISDAEALDTSFGLPAESAEKVEDAASLMHMMNANTFTCSDFRIKENVNATELAGKIFDNLNDRQWVCGMPDKVIVMIVGRDVITVFGEADLVETFTDKVSKEFPQSRISAEGNIAL